MWSVSNTRLTYVSRGALCNSVHCIGQCMPGYNFDFLGSLPLVALEYKIRNLSGILKVVQLTQKHELVTFL